MSVIYLEHPRHGQKVAISEAEAAYDVTRGWQRFDPEARQQATAERKKPGPKPKADPVPNFLAQPAPDEDDPSKE